MDYIKREDAFSDAMCKGVCCQECPFLINPAYFGCKIENYIKAIPAADVIERKVNKISDVEFLYNRFKDIPGFIYSDCECDGAPGIMMIIPIGEKEINLYFDFYGNLCKG